MLGCISSLNDGSTLANLAAFPMDLFRYSSPEVNSFDENATAYASADGGVTDLGTFNSDPANTLDRSDWATPNNSTSTDEQNSQFHTGEIEEPSISDEIVLKALGYTPNDGNGLFNGAKRSDQRAPQRERGAGARDSVTAGRRAGLAGLLRRRTQRLVAN